MNKITALCDKIIELDNSLDNGKPMVPTGSLKEYWDISIDNSAKLARALKVAITNLEKMTDIRLPVETLEEIEEIFNPQKLIGDDEC